MGADADTLNLLHRALQLTVTPVIVTAPPVPLVDVIVKHYEGSTDKNGVFEASSFQDSSHALPFTSCVPILT